jgi:hypothetical protein
MPAVNPKYECQPCSRGNHAWCTMENECTCPNSWDGEGWRENIAREAAKQRLKSLTTHAPGAEHHSGVRPLVGAGRVLWFCADCGFKSKWWKGCERFKYCTECERRHREIERRKIALEEKQQGAGTYGKMSAAEGEAGQGVQAPLPLLVHRDGRWTASPCDKKGSSSA